MAHPAIFVHVFKAGGTSIGDWLSSHYPEEGTPADPMEFAEAAFVPENRFTRFPLIRGHISARDAVRFSGNYLLLTVLRNPESHLMSVLWHYASRNQGERMHARADIDGAAEELIRIAQSFHGECRGAQTAFFSLEYRVEGLANASKRPRVIRSARHGLAAMDSVGITERMADTLRVFAWKLGLPAPRDISHARKSGAGKCPMPDELCDLLSGQLEADRELYAMANERFLADFAELEHSAREHRSIDDYLDSLVHKRF